MAVPVPSDASGAGSMPGRTVAIWGNLPHSMSAMMFPPKAGRVIVSFLPSKDNEVQSAVRPVSRAAARRGAISLPHSVAPISMDAGEMRSAIPARHSQNTSGS